MTIIDVIRANPTRTADEHRRGHDRWFKRPDIVGSHYVPTGYVPYSSRFHDSVRSERYTSATIYHEEDVKQILKAEDDTLLITGESLASILDEEFDHICD